MLYRMPRLPILVGVLAGGCGFDLTAGMPVDAARDGAVAIDAPPDGLIDSPIDAPIDAPPDTLMCPASYTITIPGSTSRYRITSTDASFATHHAACNADLAGATHLVVFDSVAEIDAITALALAAPDPNDNRFFVGAVQAPNADDIDESWFHFTGGAVAANLWGDDHPDDNGSGEFNHEQQLAAIDAGTRMNDVSGTIDYGAICECDGKMLDPTVTAMIP